MGAENQARATSSQQEQQVFLTTGHLSKPNFIGLNSRLIFCCVNHCIFFIHSRVYGHLGCFYFLDIVNKAAWNTGDQLSLQQDSGSLGHVPEKGLAGLCGRSISSFLRIRHTDFRSGCIQFALPLAVKTSSFLISMLAFIIIFLNLIPSDRSKLKSQSNFNMHFHDN